MQSHLGFQRQLAVLGVVLAGILVAVPLGCGKPSHAASQAAGRPAKNDPAAVQARFQEGNKLLEERKLASAKVIFQEILETCGETVPQNDPRCSYVTLSKSYLGIIDGQMKSVTVQAENLTRLMETQGFNRVQIFPSTLIGCS